MAREGVEPSHTVLQTAALPVELPSRVSSSNDTHDDDVIDPAVPDRGQDDHVVNGRNGLPALPFADSRRADAAGVCYVRDRHARADPSVPDISAGRRHVDDRHFCHPLSSGTPGNPPKKNRTSLVLRRRFYRPPHLHSGL